MPACCPPVVDDSAYKCRHAFHCTQRIQQRPCALLLFASLLACDVYLTAKTNAGVGGTGIADATRKAREASAAATREAQAEETAAKAAKAEEKRARVAAAKRQAAALA